MDDDIADYFQFRHRKKMFKNTCHEFKKKFYQKYQKNGNFPITIPKDFVSYKEVKIFNGMSLLFLSKNYHKGRLHSQWLLMQYICCYLSPKFYIMADAGLKVISTAAARRF